MDKHDHIDVVAKAIYNTHWKEPPNGRFPPRWEALTEEVKDWVRKQACSAIHAYEAQQS